MREFEKGSRFAKSDVECGERDVLGPYAAFRGYGKEIRKTIRSAHVRESSEHITGICGKLHAWGGIMLRSCYILSGDWSSIEHRRVILTVHSRSSSLIVPSSRMRQP